MQFPLILYPKPIHEFLQSVKTETSNIPSLPDTPALETTTPAPFNQLSQTVLLQLVLAVNFILLAGAIFFNNFHFWLLVLLFLTCSSVLILAGKKFSKGNFYQKYLLDKETSQKEYEQQRRTYKKFLNDRIKIQLTSHKDINDRRKKLYAQLTQSLMLPKGYSTAQQGASELQFKHYLDRYFPGHIHQGFKLPIPGSDLFYSADFTYVNKLISLYIDIEIDEPYYYKTKKPTHCYNDERDKNRNNLFVSNNWVVIRFAEEQVVCYPNRCCKVIARVVAEITGEWELYNKFDSVPELPTIKHWTVREARRMAKANYRDKYLTRFGS